MSGERSGAPGRGARTSVRSRDRWLQPPLARSAHRPAKSGLWIFSLATLLLLTAPAVAQSGEGTGTGAAAATPAAPAAELPPGDAAMQAGRYDEALRVYQSRLDAGDQSAALHYDMGLAAAHLEHIGEAFFHLTQASFLDPGSDDIEESLNLLDAERRQGRRGAQAGETLTRGEPEALFWLELFNRYPRGAVELVLLGATWLGFGLLLWRRRLAPGGRRDAAFVIAVLSLLLALGALAYRIGADATRESIEPGVVTSHTPLLYEGPDRHATRGPDSDLFEGALVLVTDVRDEWVGVELANGRLGWLPADAIGVVEVPAR